MSHRLRLAVAIMVVTGLTPSRSEAQSWSHSWELCTTSHFSSCNSVTVVTHAIMSGSSRVGTTLSISLHNFQGQGHPNDNLAGSGIHEVFLSGQGVNMSQTSGTTGVGTAAGGATGSANWDWYSGHYVAGIGPMGFVSIRSHVTDVVGGCNTTPFWMTPTVSTCAPGSTYTFTFSIADNVDANQLTGMYLYAGSASGAGTWCWQNRQNFNADGMGDCLLMNQTVTDLSTVSTVPEPITIALLGTGLVGVGGARLRRKKDVGGD